MRTSLRYETVAAEHPSVSSRAKEVPKQLEMLSGDEIIQFSIRPSWWSIPLVCWRWLLGLSVFAFAVVALSTASWMPVGFVALQLVVCALLVRLGYATLLWASSLYVLTNRRVLTFRGVVSVSMQECSLTAVAKVELRRSRLERFLGLGTIVLTPVDESKSCMVWEYVGRAEEVFDRVERAVGKARGGM